MKILTLNCRQWSRDLKKKESTYWVKRAKKIAKLICRENPDIICFQELTFPMTLFIPKEYKKAVPFSISHHIYCKKNFKVALKQWHLHWCRAILTPEDGSTSINVFSVHSHWDDKIYTRVINQILNRFFYASWIINIAGGDWNTDPEVIEPFLRGGVKMRKTNKLTFQNWTKPEQQGSLDYFITLNGSYQVNKLDDFISDHYPVILEDYYETAD